MDDSIGVILISTRDSFSKMISLICDNPYTTIGIYYPVSVNGDNFICTHLYNIWENSTPVWVNYFMKEKSHTGHLNLDEITKFHLVDKIIMYPVKNEYKNRFKVYFSKIIAIEENAKGNNSFEWLLSFVTNNEYRGKANTTGYDIVNYIIKMISNSSCSKPLGTMELITPNLLLFPKRKNNITYAKLTKEIDRSEIFSDQLDNLLSTFKKMYISSDIFRAKLVDLKYEKILTDYINIEDNLHGCMKKGLSCKDMIESMNEIRDKISAKSLREEDCYDDKRDKIAEELLNFRSDLTKILRDISAGGDPIIIYLDKFLSHYNNICDILGVTTLDIPEIPSTSAIITTDLSVTTSLSNNFITTHVSRLDRYSKEELREILKTINEITIVDPKYISLQNSIAQELSRRIKND